MVEHSLSMQEVWGSIPCTSKSVLEKCFSSLITIKNTSKLFYEHSNHIKLLADLFLSFLFLILFSLFFSHDFLPFPQFFCLLFLYIFLLSLSFSFLVLSIYLFFFNYFFVSYPLYFISYVLLFFTYLIKFLLLSFRKSFACLYLIFFFKPLTCPQFYS